MTRVCNATDFLQRFREIQNDYEKIFKKKLTEIRKRFAGTPEEILIDQTLEAHSREYLVDALLAALNWRLDKGPAQRSPNLFPEVPVRSEKTKNIRFLDYLGTNRESDKPLMIVETKRSKYGLPRGNRTASTFSEIFSIGLAGEKLIGGDWNKWIEDLRDYVLSVQGNDKGFPKRVVITNGIWLIIFLDPPDAFLAEGSHDPTRILVFSKTHEMEEGFSVLFDKLEYGRVLGEAPPLDPGELPFYADGETINRIMHGLRLRYIEQQGIYQRSPVIKIAPVALLRSMFGGWLRVESPPREFELPHKSDKLTRHLSDVEVSAENLINLVNQKLGTNLQPFSLESLFDDETSFEELRGVTELEPDEYLIITGDKTHYILANPSVANCAYHDWSTCKIEGLAAGSGPIVNRCILPRSFFKTTELHHCAHQHVSSAKKTPLNITNRTRWGIRSGLNGQAFCEIWPFERHLCCRACVFERICTKVDAFQLPC